MATTAYLLRFYRHPGSAILLQKQVSKASIAKIVGVSLPPFTALSRHWRGSHIKACVQPGPIDSEKTTANGEFVEILKKLMALPRYGTTIEIVEMVAHLADPTLVHHGCDPHH